MLTPDERAAIRARLGEAIFDRLADVEDAWTAIGQNIERGDPETRSELDEDAREAGDALLLAIDRLREGGNADR